MTRTRKPVWPEIGWSFRLAAALAALIVLICTFNSLLWINRPFPGFFLEENLFVPAVGNIDWTGYEAGVPHQSRLLTVDGERYASASEVYRAIRKLPIGTPVTYTFALADAASPVTLRVKTMRLELSDYLWTFGTYILIGSMLILLGFVVVLIRPDRPAATAMFIAGIAWGVFLVTSADVLGPAWFRPFHILLEALLPVALLQLGLTFPVERKILGSHPRLLPSLYVFALTVGVLDIASFDRSFGATLAFNHFNAGAVTLAGLVLIGLLVHSYFFPPSSAAQQRTKIAILGGVLAFLSPVVGYLLLYVTGVSIPFNFLAIPLALFPVAIGWAIVKHNLFEIDAIIRRAVAWAILTGLIAALYLGGVGTLELLFARRSGRVAQLFFLLALVAVMNPLRNRVQAAIDFLFARDRYDYRKIVAEASQALATLLNLEAVVRRILRTVTQTIHVDFGAVWLRRDEDRYELQAVAGERRASELPREIDGNTPLVRRLAQRPQKILSEEALRARDGFASQRLVQIGTRLLVPMSFEQRLVGFLALGQKENGRFYNGEDLELLRTLANQGAVAVENARSYRALVRANEELRAAQSRLIEAERFAAIGELSASVAHGIRNPLAGIKAAAQFADLDLPKDHPLRENIVDIISEVDKLESRIKALLDFAKPFEPRPAPCDVARIIADAVASLRSQITAQGITLITEIDPSLPEVQLDYAQIEQVLLALMSNAVEAMPGGGQLTVSARPTPDAKQLSLSVADTGPGISPEQKPALFQLFFTAKPNGTGLGLAVAKKIVELHGGTIAAESEVGRGSRFTIRLPLTAPLLSREAIALRAGTAENGHDRIVRKEAS
jgi:signal transduction histidine kinase